MSDITQQFVYDRYEQHLQTPLRSETDQNSASESMNQSVQAGAEP